MNKKVLATAGVAAIAITGTVAQADETTAVDQAPATVAASSVATQSVPTQAQVDAAKAQADAASQAASQQATVVANQEAVVKQAQDNLASANADVEKAQALAKEATSENMAQAQADLTSTVAANDQAQVAVKEAQAAEQAAKDAVAKQETVVKANQENVASKTSEVAEAQKAVDSAKAALNGTTSAEAATKQAQAQTAYDAAQAAVRQAQSDVDSAKTTDAELAKSIATKEAQVTADQAAANAAKAAMESAQTAANEKASALAAAADAKAKADAANAGKDTAKTKQVFKVTWEYVNALKTYESTTASAAEKAQALATLKAINDRERQSNTFQDSEADKAVTITDLNKMTEAQRTDLSMYASSLINQVRTAFGTTQTSVTKGSVLAADRVADGYVADNWGWNAIERNQHNDAALDRAGKSFNEITIGENLNTWKGVTGPMSLNEVKKYIFEAMLDFMFNGEEWNHARSIAGILADGGEAYIGADISVVADAFNVHINNINKNYLKSGNNFDTTKLANPYEQADQSRGTSSKEQADATAAYNAAKAANDQAQSDLTSKKAAYNAASLKLNQSQAELANLKATPSRLTAAQKVLSEKQAVLATAKTELDKANAVVASLNESAQAKAQALTAAQTNLDQKQEALQEAQATLSASRVVLRRLTNSYNAARQNTAQAQAALTQTTEALGLAKSRVRELANASSVLAQAQAARAKAQVILTSEQEVLSTQRSKLEDLLAERDRLTNQYGVAQTALDIYLKAKAEEERKFQLGNDLAIINSEGWTPVPLYDDRGRIIGFIAEEDSVQSPTAVTVSYKHGKAKNDSGRPKTDLPETGESTAALSSLSFVGLFMTLLAFLGLVDKRTRRN